MKLYYKYAAGYININEENLYLTNTGNWQEARELTEKNPKSVRKNNMRITRMKGFVFTVFGALASYVVAIMNSDKTLSIGILVGLSALAYFVLQYFKSDFGRQYKIPTHKIERIEKYEKGLKIIFLNGNNEPDFEIVDNVDPAGVDMLTKLKPVQTI